LDRDQITRSLELHRQDKETSIEDYIERLQRQLGLKLSSRQAIYLDTRYWIFLRDVVLGRPQKPAHTQLPSRLRQCVLSGAVFCPISSATFAELLSQTMPASRLITAGIVDELSLASPFAMKPSVRDRIRRGPLPPHAGCQLDALARQSGRLVRRSCRL
jgi:hypothetical protein